TKTNANRISLSWWKFASYQLEMSDELMSPSSSSSITATIVVACVIVLTECAIADTLVPGRVRTSSITDPTQLQWIRAEFQFQLGHEGYVAECHHAIDYVEDMLAGHDSSYGAICAVAESGVKKDWMMCNDRIVGKFAKTDHFDSTADAVTNFIQDHCPPGG